MKTTDKSIAEGRKNFLKTTGLALAGFVVGKGVFKIFKKQDTQPAASGEMIKMLTTDGRLVEVDKAYILSRKKATSKDVINWVHKNNA
jgi:hypothetical protein